ncbi:MAG: hypothetical protein JNJ54_08950 [Myxococcaceae bacterium]|nr:hypothetical protein [Myxococcaceae bacterium]
MPTSRRVAVTVALACAGVVTIATSPPRRDFPDLHATRERQVLLDPTTPTFATHATVRLAATHNGAPPDGGRALGGWVEAEASGCLVGVDSFNDAGSCVSIDESVARPTLELVFTRDGEAAGIATTREAFNDQLFERCVVGSDCTHGFTLKVSLARGETRPTVVTLKVSATASGGTVDPGDPNGLTITEP